MAERRQRLWLAFAVEGSLKWLGHLGLLRAWRRALRRARLPLLYSQGFHPRPRISIAFPLPVGFSGERELLDMLLTRPLPPLEVARRVRPHLPAGLSLKNVEEADVRAPSLQSQLRAAEYLVRLTSPSDLPQRVQELLSKESCPRERRGKQYDLRPLIRSLSVEGDLKLRMVLQAGDRGTGRPDEVLLALGLDPSEAAIHRRRLYLASDRS
ncbi:MAG: TIGR03936 family radical SAM-associated protein [Chloroflexota bacterium]|nr:TIGR03936 family radical SAM-associated protein [Chloroflexota bacterium]